KTTHVFKTVDKVKIEADVYRSDSAEKRPVLVWLHGGALIMGGRNSVPRNLLDLCADKNFVCVSFDYRLAPEVKLPDIAADVKDAFRWLLGEGPKLFNADTSRLVVTGGSGGGDLTLLTRIAAATPPPPPVPVWGVGD